MKAKQMLAGLTNPDLATLIDQRRYASRQYSKWYSRAWGTALLAGFFFFFLPLVGSSRALILFLLSSLILTKMILQSDLQCFIDFLVSLSYFFLCLLLFGGWLDNCSIIDLFTVYAQFFRFMFSYNAKLGSSTIGHEMCCKRRICLLTLLEGHAFYFCVVRYYNCLLF